MMLLAGTVPVEGLPLTCGAVTAGGEFIVVDGRRVPCTQGTAAMISAALATTGYLGLEPPQALVAGDTGRGEGSRAIYKNLIENIARLAPRVLTLHYCMPDMSLTRKLCDVVGKCDHRPIMIADAASMYAAKAAGLAEVFDIFTPDATEMAFLADPEAIHPAYIARHLFDTDISRTPELVATACRNRSAAWLLLVKGETDYVVSAGRVVGTVAEPDVPALEAIGGTGDTITGLVSAFAYAGLEPHEAALIAARANRVAGQAAQATPGTRVWQVIEQFPAVFREHLCRWSRICLAGGGTP